MILRRVIEHVKAQNSLARRRHPVRDAARSDASQTRDLAPALFRIPDQRCITSRCNASGMTALLMEGGRP